MAANAELFKLVADFAVSVIVELIANAYRVGGKNLIASKSLPSVILPIAEEYFNMCAVAIENRSDAYINEKFDKMTSIQLDDGKYSHPIDLLEIIVLMTVAAINMMEISDIAGEYKQTIEAAYCHIKSIIMKNSNMTFHSCNHVHGPITTKLFDFNIQFYTVFDKKKVKLTHM